jgi:transposase
VDWATHRVVDLRPDRSALSVAAWLAQHPTITVVCRDRSNLYAEGLHRGVPQAVQVVDCFHLVHNLRQVLEAFLRDHRAALQAAPSRGARHPDVSGPAPAPQARPTRRGRATLWARPLGISRPTV